MDGICVDVMKYILIYDVCYHYRFQLPCGKDDYLVGSSDERYDS